MKAFLQLAIVVAALHGFWSACSVDLYEWMRTPGWTQAGFNWGLATKRWAVGTLSTVLVSSGLGAAVALAWWMF